eukprot:1530461-Rhodomonas_salina.1
MSDGYFWLLSNAYFRSHAHNSQLVRCGPARVHGRPPQTRYQSAKSNAKRRSPGTNRKKKVFDFADAQFCTDSGCGVRGREIEPTQPPSQYCLYQECAGFSFDFAVAALPGATEGAVSAAKSKANSCLSRARRVCAMQPRDCTRMPRRLLCERSPLLAAISSAE